MPIYDQPFDPDRPLRPGCICGRHRSPAEHEASRTMVCEPVASQEKIYEGVVANAVMRKIFPKDAARRAFLKSVGASTALAALSQFFPLKTATEVFAQGGALEKKDLKVGFIPITCATPIIMAHPMGFYTKHGLNVEVIKTAGWAVIRDKTLNKEYDAAHMLSPMPLAISLGVGSNPVPYTVPAIENINGQAITLAREAQGQARSEVLEGLQVRGAVRLLDAQLSAALLPRGGRPRSGSGRADPCGAAARDGGEPARRQHRRLPRSRSDEPARRVRWRRLHPHAVEGDVGRPPVLRLRGVEGVHHRRAEHLRGAAEGDHRCDRLRYRKPRTGKQSPRPSRPRTTSTSR